MRNRIITSSISVNQIINIPAAPAWEMLSGFARIEEFSPIAKSKVEGEGVGAKRTCIMPDGTEIKEVLTKLDHDLMEMVCEIIDSPLPVESHKVNVQVTPKGADSCEVHYESSYQVEQQQEEEIMQLLQGVYIEIIHGLERYIKVA